MRVALLFIDGVGIGPPDPRSNPLAREQFLQSQFLDGSGAALPPGGWLQSLDTTFGMPGRPQSASNQTAIYAAVDAPRLVEGHVAGYPSAALRRLLKERSIAQKIRAARRTVTSANVYPLSYLDALGLPHAKSEADGVVIPHEHHRRLRASASVLAMAAGEVPLRTFHDARRGRGLTHDIDGALAKRRGWQVPTRTPTEAAEVFWELSQDFTLFEHFLADEAGHAQDADAALAALRTFDAFAREVISRRPADTCVIVCSDHGNVEDLSTRNHTTHPVAALTFGLEGPRALRTVADVGRLVLDALGISSG